MLRHSVYLQTSLSCCSPDPICDPQQQQQPAAGPHNTTLLATSLNDNINYDKMPTCVGCERRISDRYVLRVSPDLEWHAACLKCSDCSQRLDETCTCFVRDGKMYCRRDYISRFTAKCAACSIAFLRSDLVMKARDRIYHVDCFRCSVCERQLTSGDEFALTSDDLLCCKSDLDVVITAGSTASTKCTDDVDDDVTLSRGFNNNNDDMKTSIGEGENSTNSSVQSAPTNSSNHVGPGVVAKSGGRSSRSHKSEQKTTRIRTVLNEKQLHTLRTCYGANPRPDALMKEQLVEMTGLSPRVIRVWFQNKRCKDKKRSILMKQIQQHHQDAGVSMVAVSPVQHDQQSNMAPIKVHQYQLLPWAAFLPHGPADHQSIAVSCSAGGGGYPGLHGGLPLDLDQPPFQRLINTFGQLSDDEDEDDTVVSLDEPNSVHGRGGAGLRQPLQCLDSTAAAVYLRQHGVGAGPGGASDPNDGLGANVNVNHFTVNGQQGVRC